MSRIEGPTVAEDLFGLGKDGFKRGNPLTHDAATVVTEGWLNAYQEMVMQVTDDLVIDPPTVLNPEHGVLLRALNTRGFLAASKDWKEADHGFVGICLGADFAEVPNIADGHDQEQWVLVGDSTFEIQICTDGNLFNVEGIGSAISTRDVKHAFGPGSGGRWITVGDTGTIFSTSAALATQANWTVRTSGTVGNLTGIGLRGQTEVLVVGDAGDWVHSTDGVTWSTANEGATRAWKAVAWFKGNWYAVGADGGGSDGLISISSDHINWTHDDTSFVGHKFTDVVSDGTTLHAVTESGSVYTLVAGTWTSVLSLSAFTFNSIDFDGAGYVIATSEGAVLTAHQSNLGQPKNWVVRRPAVQEPDFRVVRAGAGRWVAGGSGAGIVHVSNARY